jgi:hypothetical protein
MLRIGYGAIRGRDQNKKARLAPGSSSEATE